MVRLRTGGMMEDPFPAEDVEALLQRRERRKLTDPGRDVRDQRRVLALQAGAPSSAEWIFFRSPTGTWAQECGVEGSLLYETKTGGQHSFVMTAMN